MPGTVYATLQDLDSMRVDFSVPEQQIRLIEIGMPVTVSTEVGDTELTGQISAIEPRIDPNCRLVTVRAEVDDPEGTINPGQFLRVRVELPRGADVIALPQTVLSSTLYGDSVFVVRTEGEGDAATQHGRAGLRQGRPAVAGARRDRRGREARRRGGDRGAEPADRRRARSTIDNTRQPAAAARRDRGATRRARDAFHRALHPPAGALDRARAPSSCCSASRASSTCRCGSIRRSRRRW